MISQLKEFLKQDFNFELQPKYVLSDNSDAIITGYKKSFKNGDYVHLLRHFHIDKNIWEKNSKQTAKGASKCHFVWIKVLKNSQNLTFFRNTWTLINKHWKDKGVPDEFISCFEKEDIKKRAVALLSFFLWEKQSNNSLESGNKTSASFFNRKAPNVKGFWQRWKIF